MSEARLSLIILAVTDLDAAAAFYRSAFGWRPAVEVPVYVEFELPGGMRLGLYQREAFVRNFDALDPGEAAGLVSGTELYFQTEALPEAIARLRHAGGRTVSELKPRDWGDEAAYFLDPDGNIVVAARPISDQAIA
jgi:catechol 2,3-dioxygenase-like lactoylglutathione lyase family enzyme